MSDIIADLITSIPPGVNPYAYLSEAVVNFVVPISGNAFSIALAVNSVALGFAICLAIFIVAMKIRQRNTWLFHVRHTSQGRLILPHASFTFALVSAFP